METSQTPANQVQDCERKADLNIEPSTATEPERLYTIGDMARDFAVSLRTLRFYEDRGLLHPRRRGTTRLYDTRDRFHLRMILKGKQLGFTLAEIHDILAARGNATEELDLELGLHPEQIVAQIEHLERQRHELDEAIVELRLAHQRMVQQAQNSSAA
jgi:DNA-binding transcriptional MerR regulator